MTTWRWSEISSTETAIGLAPPVEMWTRTFLLASQSLIGRPSNSPRLTIGRYDPRIARTFPSFPKGRISFGCGRIVSTMQDSGMTIVCPPTVTTIPSSTASVRGKAMENFDPAPDMLEIVTRPPIAWISVRTTSIPTPRPERLVTESAVENPGAKSKLSISASLSFASGSTKPFSTALFRILSRLRPRPSSLTSIMTCPERCSALSRNSPRGFLPDARRSAAGSSPWSIALRTRCVIGSARRSTKLLSTSVISPSMTKFTSLPVASPASLTIRAMRWNSGFTGCARIAITAS